MKQNKDSDKWIKPTIFAIVVFYVAGIIWYLVEFSNRSYVSHCLRTDACLQALGSHARSIEIITGWKINTERRLAVFQTYDSIKPLNLVKNIQEEWMLNTFKVAYLRKVSD